MTSYHRQLFAFVLVAFLACVLGTPTSEIEDNDAQQQASWNVLDFNETTRHQAVRDRSLRGSIFENRNAQSIPEVDGVPPDPIMISQSEAQSTSQSSDDIQLKIQEGYVSSEMIERIVGGKAAGKNQFPYFGE